MAGSQAYLLLVTKRSLKESRPWVRWEMFEAQAMAKDHAFKFIPCLLNVPSGALSSTVMAPSSSEWAKQGAGEIPDSALHPEEFQGIDVGSPEGLEKLALALEAY